MTLLTARQKCYKCNKNGNHSVKLYLVMTPKKQQVLNDNVDLVLTTGVLLFSLAQLPAERIAGWQDRRELYFS